MKNSNSLLRPFLFAMILGTVVLSGCKGEKEAESDDKAKSEQAEKGKDGKEAEKKADAVPVEVAAVTRRAIAATYSGTANLEAPGESQVVAKTSGVMVQLLAEEGDIVRKGQVLARLDGDKARLQAAGAAATVHKLENNYRRSQQLREQKLVSAESNDQLRYELESARAQLDLAKLELSYTQITAPISGVVAQRMVKPGNLIGLNAPVFRIVDNSHLEAVLSVPERQMATLKIGMPLRMIVDAVPGTVFVGKVDRVSPVVDTGSGTFRVVCAFDGGNNLRPGMFGRIEIVYDQRDGVLTLPRTALIEDEGESAVYIVRNKKAVRVPVQLGYVDGEVVEVRSGVKENENVITAGKVAVRDGTEVEVLKAAASAAVASDSKSPAVK
ncbi:MAG: efflux RND transporter periplasmic adaptor subunit [Arenimonas sp.]